MGAAPDRPLGVDLLTDQQAGATIMWLIGDFIGLIAGGIVLAQWLRDEQRRTIRLDRELDAQEAAAALTAADRGADRREPGHYEAPEEQPATRESRAGDRTAR